MERPRRSIPPAIRGAILIPEQKISVYVSVLNEVDSIDRLLESMAGQTRPPNELLVIDGGSDDGTIERVERFRTSHPTVRPIGYPGSNIAQARNMGFSLSSFDLVASIDAGCRADARWLENLVKAMTPDTDIVSGVFIPDARTPFEECVGKLQFPNIDVLPDDWDMPSHRSVLIRRRVWETLGGFPSHLDRSEDTWFNLEAHRRGFKFRLARDAIVRWRPRGSLVDVFRNRVRWVSSDVRYKVFPHRWRALVSLARVFSVIGIGIAVLSVGVVSLGLGVAAFTILVALSIWPLKAIRIFREQPSFRLKVTMNLIWFTESFGWVVGYLLGNLLRLKVFLARPSRGDVL